MKNTNYAFNLIDKVDKENVGLYILFKAKNKNNNEKWKSYNMKTKPNLSKEILNMTRNFISSIINMNSFDEIEYKPGPITDKYIVEIMNINELSNFKEIKKSIDTCTEIFKNNINTKKFKPFVYIIKLDIINNDNKNDYILFFQHIQKQNTFKKGKIINKITDSYDSINNELYYISDNFDCLCTVNDNMLIFNKQHFDWIFGFEDKFKEEIKQNFELNKNNIDDIININDFLDFVLDDYIFVRKIYNMIQNNTFYKYLNRETIEKVEQEANITKIRWDDNNKIIIDRENIKKLIKILNEDYLKSIISDTLFLSLNKTNL